ncbi:MAG TPA: ChaN family lipoprotein [Burkholderiales bacterium]|nr:ChaN family lipoprotein [Burkholderiales bacterium]
MERAILRCFQAATILALAGCASPLVLENHPLTGEIWDIRAQAFIPEDELLARLPAAAHVILGETHDNPVHHRLQRRVLNALAPAGRRTLAMEQFDTGHQAALDAARAGGAGAEALADAGALDRKGWSWPLYRPLVEFALEHGWPITAANLSRAEARRIVADPAASGLAPISAILKEKLEHDMIEGHCGQRPDAKRLTGMIEAQRARDARMAEVLAAHPSTVLVAGSGHARRDRGVPAYMRGRAVLSVAFVEVEADKITTRDYAQEFDYLWFTARAVRDDPCKTLK